MRAPIDQHPRDAAAPRSWRAMALLEVGKGCTVLAAPLLVAVGGWQWPLQALRSHHFVVDWSRSSQDLLLAVAGGYAALRFIEAAGLWQGRPWARWTSLTGYFAYIPLELWQLAHGGSHWLIGVLVMSVGVATALAMQPLPQRAERKLRKSRGMGSS
jgi:uncharacterized membrane protein (DUF2068 family)